MANKALVYAIYPNEKQNIQCQKTFGCCRIVYNHMLSLQQDRYENGKKHLNKKNANNYCNQQLKKDYPFLKEVDKFALTNAILYGIVKAWKEPCKCCRRFKSSPPHQKLFKEVLTKSW